MSDEDSVCSKSWRSLLSGSELNSKVFEVTKKYGCKFEDCKRSFTHSQSRSRHYRLDHAANMPPKEDPTKSKESTEHQESQRPNESMVLANAAQEHKAFEAVLALFAESDRNSIEYLTTFHTLLGIALQHSKMISEGVKVDVERTRLLKRALNEIVDEDIHRTDEFSSSLSKRFCSARSPHPASVDLDNADEPGVDTRRARNTPPYPACGFGTASTDRECVRADHSNRASVHTCGVFAAGFSGSAAIIPVNNTGSVDPSDSLFATHPEAFNWNIADDLLRFDAPLLFNSPACDASSHHDVVGYCDSTVLPLPVGCAKQQALPAAAVPHAAQRAPPPVVQARHDPQPNNRSPFLTSLL